MSSIPQRKACLVLLAALLAGTGGCDRRPEVVLYASADTPVARAVIDAFEADSGIRVRFVGDTEAKKTSGLVERLRSERDRPVADVFWSSEIFQTIELAEEGVLAPFESAVTDVPSRFRDPQNRWFGFAARARVIVVNRDRVPPEDQPTTWTDLTQADPEYRIVMADPRFGTTGGHLGAMKAYWDRHAVPGYYEAFMIGLRDRGVRMLPSGNAGVVEAVAGGEADLGLTDTDDAWIAIARGFPIEVIVPDHHHGARAGQGTLLIPNTAGLVAGRPHPVEAARLLEFILSERVERLLVDAPARHIPLRPSLAAQYPDRAIPRPLDVNYQRAAGARTEAIGIAMRVLTEPVPSDDEGANHEADETPSP